MPPHRTPPAPGFTLIELSFVLIVIGMILTVAVGSWQLLKSAREIAKTEAILRQAKNCLMERMVYSLRYPTYTDGLLVDCSNADQTKDVDACLCQPKMRDAWGGRLRYIDGYFVNATGSFPLTEQSAVTVPTAGIEAINPDADSKATIATRTHQYIAFILLSHGKNRVLDYSGNISCFEDDNRLVGDLRNCTPNFYDERIDDQYIIVSGPEIRGWLSE